MPRILIAPIFTGGIPASLVIAPGCDVSNESDIAAKTIGWFGMNPNGSRASGAWVGGGLWIGGTNAGNAPIFADATGNLTIRNGTLFGVGSGAIFSGDAGGSVRINNSSAPGGPVPLDVTGKVRSSTGFRVGNTDGATGYVTFTGSANGVNGIIRLNFSGGLITGTEIIG